MRLGDVAPNFKAMATGYMDSFDFYEYCGTSWVIFFSHPADFTPVCTTELGHVAKLQDEFCKRNTKTIGLSIDELADHNEWSKDIEETQGCSLNFPIVADYDQKISTLYDMLDQETHDPSNKSELTGLPLTVRSVFIIDPEHKLRLILTYPASVGRNFHEILRVLDALQLSDAHKIATPANWAPGDDVIVRFDVQDDEAEEIFGKVRIVKPYLRFTACPSKE